MKSIPCPVPECTKSFGSFLDLARHMVMTSRPSVVRPSGEEICWLEDHLDKEFEQFGWKSDKRIATALARLWKASGDRWPSSWGGTDPVLDEQRLTSDNVKP